MSSVLECRSSCDFNGTSFTFAFLIILAMWLDAVTWSSPTLPSVHSYSCSSFLVSFSDADSNRSSRSTIIASVNSCALDTRYGKFSSTLQAYAQVLTVVEFCITRGACSCCAPSFLAASNSSAVDVEIWFVPVNMRSVPCPTFLRSSYVIRIAFSIVTLYRPFSTSGTQQVLHILLGEILRSGELVAASRHNSTATKLYFPSLLLNPRRK
jgi:hypothetical protein